MESLSENLHVQEAVLRSGHSVNDLDESRLNPLLIVAMYGNSVALETFVNAGADVQKAGVETLGMIYLRYPGKSANPPGGLHPQGNSERNFLVTLAAALQVAPGGLDALYEVSKKLQERHFPQVVSTDENGAHGVIFLLYRRFYSLDHLS